MVLVAGIAVGLAVLGSTDSKQSSKLTIRRAVATGAPVSQASRSSSQHVPAVQVARPTITPPLRDLRPEPGKANKAFKSVVDHSRTDDLNLPDTHAGSALVQHSAPKGLMPAPMANFEGVNNVNGVYPPDTEGDVGPNYYMQWVNLSFRIFNKNGTPATGIIPGYQMFTGKAHCGVPSGNGGDPIVLYDQFSDRWLASQLAYPTFPNGPFYQCVAVSQTGDPTGSWCSYEYIAHQTNLNDYPKFGVWPTQHAYMITVNQFSEPGDGWAGVGVFALERDQLINCGAARMIYKDMFSVEPNLWGGMLPADVDGTTLPPANAPAPLIEVDDHDWDPVHFPVDRLDVWNATVDWAGAGTISVSHEGPLATAPFDGNLCGFALCVPQPGTSQKLDTLSDRLMYRLAYRNFGDHQALVVNHSVDSDGLDHAGVRWYELRKTTGNWSIYQQSTYEPDTTVNRWMGSAAMDHDGNMAVGFSTSSGVAPNYPGIRYAGRLVTDPLNQLSQGEATLLTGTGSQTGSFGRWGDYSMLTVDPTDDCTFWYTNEYVQTTGPTPWRTRVGSFKFPTCVGAPPPPPPPPPPPLLRHLLLPRRLSAAASREYSGSGSQPRSGRSGERTARSAGSAAFAPGVRFGAGSSTRRRGRARSGARASRSSSPSAGPSPTSHRLSKRSSGDAVLGLLSFRYRPAKNRAT
ncbi:MAG: hypothetical protein E6G31_07315 [Actinobacteria bacterium]|nr:MAG: hypothetical protein E6G31_07315 [Actinomycetota bacterium]